MCRKDSAEIVVYAASILSILMISTIPATVEAINECDTTTPGNYLVDRNAPPDHFLIFWTDGCTSVKSNDLLCNLKYGTVETSEINYCPNIQACGRFNMTESICNSARCGAVEFNRTRCPITKGCTRLSTSESECKSARFGAVEIKKANCTSPKGCAKLNVSESNCNSVGCGATEVDEGSCSSSNGCAGSNVSEAKCTLVGCSAVEIDGGNCSSSTDAPA